MSRESSKGPTIERLVQQWRTPEGYEPSYNRFMKVLKHLGLTDKQAVTEEGQAKIEAELLSRKWKPASSTQTSRADRAVRE